MPGASTSPTLILLPGLHGTAALFRQFRAAIPAHHTTRAIEYPTNRSRTCQQLFDQVEAQLAGERDMVLIAESFSGPLALKLAAAHPARVSAVILCASFISAPVPAIFCYLATPLVLLRVPIPGIAVRVFLSGFRAPRAIVDELKQEVRLIRPHVLAHRIRQAAWLNASDALKNCPVPILCFGATRDRLVGARSTRRIRRLRPDLTIHKIDAPHLLLQTQPAKVWASISNFLNQLGTASDSPTQTLSPAASPS